MKWQRFLIETPKRLAPAPSKELWEQTPTGYFIMTKTMAPAKRLVAQQIYDMVTRDHPGAMNATEFELQVFLNVVHDLQSKHVNLFELGAGRGDWCLALAGVVDFGLIPTTAESYKCLTIEIDPTHYLWTTQHLKSQKINGSVVHGAAWHHDGCVGYKPTTDPAVHYGQHATEIEYDGPPDFEKGLLPCFTIDTLMAKFGFDHVDIIHLDVQGSEGRVLAASKQVCGAGGVDYIIVGTHHPHMNKLIRDLLATRYDILVDLPLQSRLRQTPIGKVYLHGDGVMLLKRKGL